MKITKYQSSGSDHIVIYVPRKLMDSGIWPRSASHLCDRSGPFGADGVAVISWASSGDDVRLRAFTPDGNEPVPCINAAMCGACAVFSDDPSSASLDILCGNATYKARRLATDFEHVSEVEFESAPIKVTGIDSILTISQQDLEGILRTQLGDCSDVTFYDVGTPQLHFFTPRINELNLANLSKHLNVSSVSPKGVNVSAVGSEPSLRLIRTFERGGAGLTLSCASATACGALLQSSHLHPITGAIPVVSKGGKYVVHPQQHDSHTWTARISGLVSPIYSTDVTVDYLEALCSGRSGVTQISGSLYLEAISEHKKIVEKVLQDSGFQQWCV